MPCKLLIKARRQGLLEDLDPFGPTGHAEPRRELGITDDQSPPAGPLTFYCEWPAHRITKVRVVVDAAQILTAAHEAVTLWD